MWWDFAVICRANQTLPYGGARLVRQWNENVEFVISFTVRCSHPLRRRDMRNSLNVFIRTGCINVHLFTLDAATGGFDVEIDLIFTGLHNEGN